MNYVGAQYTITTEGENNSEDEITYYTTFEAALGVIDTVDDKTIYVNVNKITTNFTVTAGQTVEMNGASVVVSSDVVVTVEAEGTLTGITNVEGMVVVKDGGDCTIPRGGYAVKTESADQVTYAGLKVAIANAQPGDVIEIGTGSTTESLTIPQGVTVTVKESLVIGGDLTVAQGAKLDVRGTLQLTKTDAKVTVYGELDASRGTVTGDYALTSTGTSTFATGNAPAEYNGAKYTNNNGAIVFTSVANAVAYAAQNDLPSIDVAGTFSETADIAVDGVDINVAAGSKVTFGNVSIKDATILNNGVITGTITGLTGDGSATAVVELTESGADVSCTSVIDAAGATTYTTYIDSYSGTMVIASGTVVLDAENEVTIAPADAEADSFTIASGATLKTDVAVNFSGKNVKINGTLDVQSTVSFKNMTVAGTVAVNENGVLNINEGVTVTGTITVSDEENKEGTLNINKSVNIGAKPEGLSETTTGSIVGDVNLVDGYVYMYSGATLAEAVFNADNNGASTAKVTAFYVNDKLFVTVYAMGGTVSAAGISAQIDALEGIATTQANIKWTADGEEIDETTTTIGRYAELRTEVEYQEVTIIVSAGPGLEVYIDDVEKNGETKLTVGDHTVTVYVKAGYTGTPSITFNGQAVTGNTITITPDMIDADGQIVLYTTGAEPSTGGTTVVDNGDSGMGLTDYLLIILVILIVVMAIMVAMRLMRS